MNAYYKSSYIEVVSPWGDTEKHWIYAHYNSVVDTWTFMNENGSSEIYMFFEDTSENKLTCIWGIYTGDNRIEIDKEEYIDILKRNLLIY